jgi:hypothetical protein
LHNYQGIPIRVNIPFDFLVRGKTLPAGEYEISRLSDEPQVLEISNIRNRHDHAAIETDPVQGTVPNHGKVVFHRYGDSYFLHEIWTTGLETGRELPASHQEKMLRRETLGQGRICGTTDCGARDLLKGQAINGMPDRSPHDKRGYCQVKLSKEAINQVCFKLPPW